MIVQYERNTVWMYLRNISYYSDLEFLTLCRHGQKAIQDLFVATLKNFCAIFLQTAIAYYACIRGMLGQFDFPLHRSIK